MGQSETFSEQPTIPGRGGEEKIMRIKKKAGTVAAFIVALGLVVGVSTSASASEPIVTVEHAKVTSSSLDSSKVTATSKTQVGSKTVLYEGDSVKAAKAAKTKVPSGKRPVIKTSSYTKSLKKALDKKLKSGKITYYELKYDGKKKVCYNDSGWKKGSNQTVWIKYYDCVDKNHKTLRVYKGDINGKCWNRLELFPVKAATLKASQVILLKSTVKAWAKVSVKVSSTAKASADAECEIPGSSKAKAHAEAYGSASATATGYASASTLVKAIADAKKNGQKLAKIDADAKASASAESTASSTASAEVTCESTTQPPTPPVVSPPTIVDLTQINDVDITNTTQVCATANVPESNSGTLTFAARFGSFSTTKTFNVSGQVEKCTTYQAPTEVPSGGTDTITVTVRDNVTGKSASDTTTFKIGNPVVPKDSTI